VSDTADTAPAAFDGSRAAFEGVVGWLDGATAGAMAHGEVEGELDRRGRELLRQMFQDHLDRRAQREERVEVVDAAGVARGSVERGHGRGLATIFGAVHVERLAYRQRGEANLHPADAVLNLPSERHSHGLRLVAAIESSRGSFDDAADAIGRGCGQSVGKRQVEALAAAAAADFEEFYTTADPGAAEPGDVVVLTCDGKGIVMRPGELRPETAKAAARTTDKANARLGKHEKRDRKWAHDTANEILDGKARQVAATIRSKATRAKLDPAERKGADDCAKYLTNKAAYLDYPQALSAGWPIATGVIEGACRFLVADRMDITGARWSVQGAEAILKLRALRANGDFSEYWRYHLGKERQRIHESRYAHNVIPKAA